MRKIDIQVSAHGSVMDRGDELAWLLAEVAADKVPIDESVATLVVDRLIDCMGVAVAALNHDAVCSARAQALAHPRVGGAALIGMPAEVQVHCEWAALANAAAVRELDFHDNIFDVEIGHPGDMIPAIVAVCQQAGRTGQDLLFGIVAAYEIHASLCKAIELQAHAVDHIGHLLPAMAGGIGAALNLDVSTIYQAIQQAVHTGYSPGQTRKGHISSWKSYAPGHASLLAINAVDRAMRGEDNPSPVFEGEHGLIVAMLGGNDWSGQVQIPEIGEPKRQALQTFTKEHAAGYHGQAAIDLAFKLRSRIADTADISSIVYYTKRRTHMAMGSGSNDARKYNPAANRETLDHSLMYMMAVALQDGEWHHIRSYLPERAARPDTVALWRKISTAEDEAWNQRYSAGATIDKDHGGRAVVVLKSGEIIEDEIAVPNAHPRGANPMNRTLYMRKFLELVEHSVVRDEVDRFFADVQRLPALEADSLHKLNIRSQIPVGRGGSNGIY